MSLGKPPGLAYGVFLKFSGVCSYPDQQRKRDLSAGIGGLGGLCGS